MNHFKLNLGTFIQGTFVLKPINIAFVFQVNCPGCFIYGFPTMNELYTRYKQDVGFIGVSTAFEDYKLNTVANTELLLKQGITVGETKKYLDSEGLETYEQIPEFPIAFDKKSSSENFLTEENITNLITNLSGDQELSAAEKASMYENIKQHYNNNPEISETFTLNQMQGTPSYVIFKDNYEILAHSFGHHPSEVLEEILKVNLTQT